MKFSLGVDYYPEHWPETEWTGYAALMNQAGFNIVRLAEFAWARMEPAEGHFEFEWLDRAIATLWDHGLSVILGTPTAVMPAWVQHKYPETLASYDGNHRTHWGVRKNNCFTSGTYRLLSERITTAMAEHFASHPAVAGWQTDNEMDGPMCRCETCRREFHVFLKEKYAGIDALNKAWGTHFWGHLFSEWAEIPVANDFSGDNPSLCLDWHRFQTSLQVRFQRDQIAILRKLCPGQFITHNYMGSINTTDCYRMAEDLDFASLDSYPAFTKWNESGITHNTAFSCDLTRGLKGKNFWILETTAGPMGWGEFSRAPRPGELRKLFYQHVAHGADGQLFFRWRTCTAGREQYWHGLLGHDGKPGRRYEEAARIGHEAKRLAGVLDGTTPEARVALIYDYDSRWATSIQPSFAGNDYIAALRRHYDALQRAGAGVDIISPQADLSRYAVVIAPQLYVMPDRVAEKLDAFVSAGGVLLADGRTGVKTETGLCHERTLPGLLSACLGIEIPEYESITTTYAVHGKSAGFGDFTAHLYADWIRPREAEVLAEYGPWHLEQYAALTRRRYGQGVGYYLGTIVQEESFYDALIAEVLREAGLQPAILPPPGVEVSVRSSANRRVIFLINHTEETREVNVPGEMRDILGERTITGPVTLGRFEVAVLCDCA